MIISQLPNIQLPSEKTLDDEDKSITEAFNTILNGYQRSQGRLRKLLADYEILRTLASELLKEHRERDSKREKKNRKSGDNVVTVDLTFDGNSPLPATNSSTSPVFGRKRDAEDESSSTTTESPVKRSERVTIDAEKRTLKRIRDEENTLPFASIECNIPESETNIFLNESKPLARIGIAKCVYSIDKHKSRSGKRSRQSTLMLEPDPGSSSKYTVGSAKQFEKNSNNAAMAPKWPNLFNGNYRSVKKQATATPEVKKRDSVEESIKFERNLPKKMSKPNDSREESFLTETQSQIDDTARSLFEDDDEFDATKDFLNTCIDARTVVNDVAFRQPENSDALKIDEAIPVTSDSIDETFFPLGELDFTEKNVKNGAEAASSSIVRVSESRETRNTEKESIDFGAQDIDWDDDINDDDWPSPNKSLNDSVDLVPEKKISNSRYGAHGSKVDVNPAGRAKLRGWDCKDCEKYYGDQSLTEDEREKHMNRCSRHKSKYNPRYCTPKDFWNPVFPATPDSRNCSSDDET